jgi:hypothetical protein
MALSKKSLALLKKIYKHHRSSGDKLVQEDPDKALEYMLQEIAERLTNPQRSDSSPLYVVTEDAVSGLRADRLEAEEQAAEAAKTS